MGLANCRHSESPYAGMKNLAEILRFAQDDDMCIAPHNRLPPDFLVRESVLAPNSPLRIDEFDPQAIFADNAVLERKPGLELVA